VAGGPHRARPADPSRFRNLHSGILSSQRSWGQSLRIVAAALALPLAYQIFRMGYYAALVPNPAFAKEASASYWSQGWRYLLDFLQPYWLLVPLLGLALLSWFPSQCQRCKRRDATGVVLAALPVAAALIHALFITRVGGDFMHGRLLLPALFAVLLPVAMVRPSSPIQLLAALVILPWAIVCAATLRVPYEGVGPERIADERGFYVAAARHPHPVTLEHYRGFRWAKQGVAARELTAEDSRLLILVGGDRVGLAPDVKASVVVQRSAIGIFSYAAGIEVYVADLHGLGDLIGGRLRLGKRSGRPGHEKSLEEAWVLARFGEPSLVNLLQPDRAEAAAAAREALGCNGPKRLLEAVSRPLTGERFLRNLLESFRLHTLRIPAGPIRAAQELC
jgi:arabinofuranosyltransferase